MITAFYTIIGFAPGPFSDTDTSWNTPRSVRSYKTPSAARGSLKQANLPPGVEYRILETEVYADGHVRSVWIDS